MDSEPDHSGSRRPILPAWLFEETDDDRDEATSLLEALDVSLLDIGRKTRWVLCVWSSAAQPGVLTSSPDFWGPLLIVVSYACLLLAGHFKVVPWVIIIWLLGSCMITFLTRVLGFERGQPANALSVPQSLAVTGYSILPLLLVVLVLTLVFRGPSWMQPPEAVIVLAQCGGVLWATRCTVSSIELDQPRLRALLVWPAFLVHVYLISLSK